MGNETNNPINRTKRFASDKFDLQPSSFLRQTGFTLLEVMISLAIVGGLLVTLLYTLNYHLGIADRHRIVTISTELAKGKMYDMEKSPVVEKKAFPDPYSDYSYETSIRPSLIPGMSEIGVVVKNGKETVSMSELVRKAL